MTDNNNDDLDFQDDSFLLLFQFNAPFWWRRHDERGAFPML